MEHEDGLFIQLRAIMKKIHKMADGAVAQMGITHVEMRLLLLLMTRYPDGCSQEKLAPRLHIDRSNVGRALKKLEQLQYIRREKSSEDQRAFRVCLTGKAWSIRDRLLEIRTAIRKRLTMGVSPEQAEAFLQTLTRINESMGDDPSPAFEPLSPLKEEKHELQ